MRLTPLNFRNALASGCCLIALNAGAAIAQSIDYELFEMIADEPATLSATGVPVRESEAPADIVIITQDEIRRSGARDIPDVLRLVPGISVWRTAAGGAEVSIRGYNQGYSRRLLVLVDGREVYANHFAFVPWSNIPVELSEIRQIEIVKGPNVALFGLNAVNGVINILTYDPSSVAVNAVEGRAANGGVYEGSGALSYKSDRFGVRVTAGAGVEDAFDVPGRDEFSVAQNDSKRIQSSLRAVAKPTDAWRFDLEAAFSDTRKTQFSLIASPAATDITTYSVKGGFDWSSEKISVSGQLFRSELDQDLRLFPATQQINSEIVTTAASVEALFKPFRKHTFRGTIEFRRNAMNQAGLDLGDVSTNIYSGAAMWDFKASEKLTVNLSGRIDHVDLGFNGEVPVGMPYSASAFDRTMTEFSANAAIVYDVTPKDVVRVLFGRGALLPSLVELGGIVIPDTGQVVQTPDGPMVAPTSFGGNTLTTGDPTLDPSRVTNIELAYEHTFDKFDATFTLKGFYNWTEDLLFSPDLRSVRDETGAFVIDPQTGLDIPIGVSVTDVDPRLASPELQNLIRSGALPPNAQAAFGFLPYSQFFQAGSSALFGIETGWTGTLFENFTYGVNYTFLTIDDNLDTESEGVLFLSPDLITGELLRNPNLFYENEVSNHVVHLNAAYTWNKLQLDGHAIWYSAYESSVVGDTLGSRGLNLTVEIPNRWHIRARAAYEIFDGLTAAFIADGLTDPRFPEVSINEAERRFLGTLTYRW